MSLKNHTSNEVIKVLTKYYSFVIKRQSGSHIQLRHPTNGRRITVPHSHKGQPVKLGTLRDILLQAGIREDDFATHL